MKLIRIAGLVLFVASTIIFIVYKGIEWNNMDEYGPEIQYDNSNLTISASASEKELLEGVTAMDEMDGDVTGTVLIEKISGIDSKGTRTITYAATDTKGNITKADRSITYTDYAPPRFSLSKPLRFPVGEEDILQYMTVQDKVDGDLTENIKYDEPDYQFGQTEGKYEITFRVANSVGDTVQLPAKVEFFYPNNQKETPEINLSQYIKYMKAGEYINGFSYLTGVTIDKKEDTSIEIKNKVMIKSKVNNQVPGIYEIDYTIKTEDGYTGSTTMLVVVEE